MEVTSSSSAQLGTVPQSQSVDSGALQLAIGQGAIERARTGKKVAADDVLNSIAAQYYSAPAQQDVQSSSVDPRSGTGAVSALQAGPEQSRDPRSSDRVPLSEARHAQGTSTAASTEKGAPRVGLTVNIASSRVGAIGGVRMNSYLPRAPRPPQARGRESSGDYALGRERWSSNSSRHVDQAPGTRPQRWEERSKATPSSNSLAYLSTVGRVCPPFPGTTSLPGYRDLIGDVLYGVKGPPKYMLRRVLLHNEETHKQHVGRACLMYFESRSDDPSQRLAEAFGFADLEGLVAMTLGQKSGIPVQHRDPAGARKDLRSTAAAGVWFAVAKGLKTYASARHSAGLGYVGILRQAQTNFHHREDRRMEEKRVSGISKASGVIPVVRRDFRKATRSPSPPPPAPLPGYESRVSQAGQQKQLEGAGSAQQSNASEGMTDEKFRLGKQTVPSVSSAADSSQAVAVPAGKSVVSKQGKVYPQAATQPKGVVQAKPKGGLPGASSKSTGRPSATQVQPKPSQLLRPASLDTALSRTSGSAQLRPKGVPVATLPRAGTRPYSTPALQKPLQKLKNAKRNESLSVVDAYLPPGAQSESESSSANKPKQSLRGSVETDVGEVLQHFNQSEAFLVAISTRAKSLSHLPLLEDEVEAVQRLLMSAGVAVQKPPGEGATGKARPAIPVSHEAANSPGSMSDTSGAGSDSSDDEIIDVSDDSNSDSSDDEGGATVQDQPLAQVLKKSKSSLRAAQDVRSPVVIHRKRKREEITSAFASGGSEPAMHPAASTSVLGPSLVPPSSHTASSANAGGSTAHQAWFPSSASPYAGYREYSAADRVRMEQERVAVGRSAYLKAKRAAAAEQETSTPPIPFIPRGAFFWASSCPYARLGLPQGTPFPKVKLQARHLQKVSHQDKWKLRGSGSAERVLLGGTPPVLVTLAQAGSVFRGAVSALRAIQAQESTSEGAPFKTSRVNEQGAAAGMTSHSASQHRAGHSAARVPEERPNGSRKSSMTSAESVASVPHAKRRRVDAISQGSSTSDMSSQRQGSSSSQPASQNSRPLIRRKGSARPAGSSLKVPKKASRVVDISSDEDSSDY